MDKRKIMLFRKTFAATGSMAAAARAAEIPLDAARRLRDETPPPALSDQGERDDLGRAVAALESEAVRRALTGVEVPVFHQGRECGNTVKHSDQLLMFLLKTLKPSRYAGGKEPAVAGPGRVVELEVDFSALDEDGAE
ncbi:MAG: hypothetical protein RDU24_13155 [Humidesulfovibrio sp.]|uniref:hypothetical protein n=1 Tax=Humidesulfovibrio sp. TaxID=2910988 RepID=UPI0027F37C0D|nr:hypothetical protein [Humidesulfovibrio sp.]MDQ7836324.1 hypothetical protein [Humidesulfovibrio sp.]